MLVSDILLYILIILTFTFIILYYYRRTKPSWYDEVIAYPLLAGTCSFFAATIILGQFARMGTGDMISYGALGLVFYFIAAIMGLGYTSIQVYLFLKAEVFKPVETGQLDKEENEKVMNFE